VVTNRNFSGQVRPSALDREYRRCNFSQPSPIDADGKKRGVRLFPGDDTPRAFINCNLTNCEPPPGSTVTRCNTSLIEPDVALRTAEVEIDGEVITHEVRGSRLHGRWDPETKRYVYLSPPIETPWEVR